MVSIGNLKHRDSKEKQTSNYEFLCIKYGQLFEYIYIFFVFFLYAKEQNERQQP